MPLPPIFTAISFDASAEDEVQSAITQPLLHDEVMMGDDDDAKQVPQRSILKLASAGVVAVGASIGFLVQIVSLGAYASLLAQYGEGSDADTNWFVYSCLSVLTQIDLGIYVLIWVAFTCTMTRGGMAFIREQYQVPVRRRSIFVLGVLFLVGIVLGAFLAWTIIDVYLGFPVPFVPIAVTVAVDLVLCYLMVFCYDLGKERTIEDEECSACC